MKKILIILCLALIVALAPRKSEQQITASPSISYKRIGKASYYSKKSPGIKRHTANNEIFDDNELTCAIWGVEFGRRIRVTNLENGKSVIVRVNDRGPSEECVLEGRVIDLTKNAFRRLGSLKNGLLNVELEFL